MIDFKEAVNGSTSEEAKPVIDLSAAGTPEQLDEDAIRRRSLVYHIALGDKTPGLSSIHDEIQSGYEDNLKDKVITNNREARMDAAGSLVQTVADLKVDPSYAQDIVSAASSSPNDESEVYSTYARKLSNMVHGMTDNEEVRKAEDAAPVEHEDFWKSTEDILTIHAGLQSLLEDTNAKYQKTSWGGWAWSTAKQFAPFYNWYQINSAIEGDSKHYLPYSNLLEEVTKIYTMDPKQGLERARKLVEDAYASDPMIGMSIAQALVDMSNDDKYTNNLLEIANLPGWGMAGKVAKGVARASKEVKVATELEKALQVSKNIQKSVVKNVMKPEVKVEEVLSGAGKIKEAAQYEALVKRAEALQKEVAPVNRVEKGIKEVNDQLSSLYNVNNIVAGAERYSKVELARLLSTLQKVDVESARLLSQPTRVSITPDNLEKLLVERASEEVRKEYNRLGDVIHEVVPYHSNDNVAGIAGVEASLLNKDASFFKTEEQAGMVAKWVYGLKDYSVAPMADGYVIKVAKDINPADKEFLDTVISTNNTSNDRWLAPFDMLRGNPKDVLPTHIVEQRGAAVHGYSLAEDIAGAAFAPIKNLSKEEYKALNRVMAHNRDTLTIPNDPDSRGAFYHNLNEFDEGFHQVNGRFPTFKESTAYFTFVRAHNIDLILRNMNAVQEKWAKGVKTYTFRADGVEKKLDGVRLKDGLPAPAQGSDILFINGKTGKSEVLDFTNANKEKLDELIRKENYSVIQTYDGLVDDKPINFIVTKNEVEKPIDFRQVNVRPGFHSVYEAEHKIVQPEIVKGKYKEFYKGDKIAYMLGHRKGAEVILDHLNTARKMLKDGVDEVGISTYLNKSLDLDYKTFKEMFNKGGFSKDAPFTIVRSGEKSINTPSIKNLYPNAQDYRENPYVLNRGDDLTFRLERGRVIQEFDKKKEGWGIQPAAQIDPISVQNREMSRLIRNRFYEPLTIATANSAIEEFGKKGILSLNGKTLTVDEMRRNPVWYFHNADITTTSLVDRKKMEFIRNAHRLLIGKPSKLEQDWLAFTGRINESMGEKFGKPVASKAIALIRNPVRYMKAVAFYTKMGFFNPVQIFVQGQTMANVYAISPRFGFGGTMAAVAQYRLALTESDEILNYAAKHYAKGAPGGLTAAEFADSYRWLKKSGIDIIKNEHAFTAGISDPSLFVDRYGKKFLDKSTMFFSGTERFLRMSAWNTAYKEYVSQYPKLAGRIDANAAKKIQIRAEAMTGNMSRDASAYWQHGVAAPFTQFYGYYFRMVDLLTGTQLSAGERARLLLTFNAMYGSGLAGAAVYAAQEGDAGAFNPFGEDLRAYALQNGVNINEGVLGAVANGIPATIIAAVTGKQVNYGERYGMGGALDVFSGIQKDIADSDNILEGMALAATGASGDITSSILSSTVPAFKYLFNAGSMPIDVAKDSIIKSARNISTVNQIANLVSALETGEYYSKNGNKLTDGIDPLEALFYSISGLTPQRISDSFSMKQVNDYTRKKISDVRKEMKPIMKHYLEAVQNNDQEKAQELSNYIDQQLRQSGVLPNDMPRVFHQLMQDQPMYESIYKDFINGTADPELLLKRRELIGQ